MIGVPTCEMARRAIFYDYLYGLEKPDNHVMSICHGQSPARGRNLIIEKALQLDCTHILFIDDDMAFAPDSLNKLLAHDVDIISGLYLMRNSPFKPVMFDVAHDDGRCVHSELDEQSGLVEVVNCGLGFVLISTEIFHEMIKPWITLGELEADQWCDDIAFFNRVREEGYEIYVDTNCPIGHMASCTIWPNKVNGKWFTAIDTAGSDVVNIPQIVSELVND